MRTLITLTLMISGMLSASAQLKVIPEGYVGIGTNAPQRKLHVAGEGLFDSYAPPGESVLHSRIRYGGTRGFSMENATSGRELFFVTGPGWVYSGQGVYTGADSLQISWKAPLEGALGKVLRMEGYRFQYRKQYLGEEDPAVRMGLDAAELRRVVPQAVATMPDSTLAVAYGDLVPLLVEALKEQQQQIETMRTRIGMQQDEIDRIKRRRWFRKRTYVPEQESGESMQNNGPENNGPESNEGAP